EETGRRCSQCEAAASTGVGDGDVLYLVGVERERETSEVVEVFDTDPVELCVSTEEREELELARRGLHLGAQLPHCIENEPALIRCADDVALRKVVAIAGEREGVASVHVVYARSEERTRVAVVHRSRNV